MLCSGYATLTSPYQGEWVWGDLGRHTDAAFLHAPNPASLS